MKLPAAAILFEDFGPYHVSRIEALASQLNLQDGKLFAYRFAERSKTYGWHPVFPKNVAEVVTLASEAPCNARESFRLAVSFFVSLRKHSIKAVFLPSYSPLPNFFCLIAVRLAGAKAIMMNESWKGTEKAGRIGRFAKHLIFRLFSAALVGGRPQVEYAESYGIANGRVFTGYDVVDVDHYAREAARWRSSPMDHDLVPPLPSRYFLNLGRFVKKKNLSFLVRAYATVAKRRPDLNIALVLVGEGEEQAKLETEIAALGLPVISKDKADVLGPRVVFYPFQQLEYTPLFFALAEAFILPSSLEEWGLVVNEAMACSTPVLVSKNVGCATDLVLDGKTGFVFDPENLDELVALLERFVDDPSLREALGSLAYEQISHWKPEFFGRQGVEALCAACAITSRRKKVVFLVESLATRSGGTALEVATIAPALASATSHTVLVVTGFDEGPHLPLGEHVRQIKLHGNQFSMRWFPAVWKLRKILQTTDVIFVTGIWGVLDGLGLRLALTSRTKLYVRVCGMLQPYILNRNPSKKMLGRLLYVDANLNQAVGLIVNSLLEKVQISTLNYRAPSLLIRNGVLPPEISAGRDVARSRLNIGKDERVLLYLGRIHPKKGIHQLLAAMVEFAAKSIGHKLPKLLVAGMFSDESYEREVNDLVARLPASETVVFVGEVTGEKKENLFAAADVFVLPSASEGLPNAVLEAMIRGLPCIITHGCNLPEIGSSGAGLVIEPNQDELIAALEWAAGPVEKLLQAGEKAKRLVSEEFSLSRTVEQYDQLICSS